MSQNGSTVYPFSGDQVRKMGQVKLEYTFLLDENMLLKEMLMHCGQLADVDSTLLSQYAEQLQLQEIMLYNSRKAYNFTEEKYSAMEQEAVKQKKRKYLYIGTTSTLVVVLLLVLFNGS